MNTSTKSTTSTTKRSKLDTITASLVPRQSRSDDDSMSVLDQIAAMREWCAKQTPPVIVGGVYPERDVSGRRPLSKRHGLRQAIEDVESGRAQMVLTAYFDRFVRSVVVRAEAVTRVEAAGGVVMTLDTGITSNATAASKLQGNLLAAIAEFYADQIGEKTRPRKQAAIDEGRPPFPNFTPAYQLGPDGRLVQSPNAPLIREACMMRAGIGYDRPKSYGAILAHLRESGLDITYTGLVSMFRSRLLCGELHFGDFTPNLHAIDEPLLTKSEFRKLHAAHVKRGRLTKTDALLARLDVLTCGTCGARLSVNTNHTERGKGAYSYYRCGNRGVCTKPAGIRVEIADEAVRDAAIDWSLNFEGHAVLDRDIAVAEAAVVKAQQRLDKALRLLVDVEDESEAKTILSERTAERDDAAAKLHRLRLLSTPTHTVRTERDWSDMTIEGRRSVIIATIRRAVVTPGARGGSVVVEPRAHR